MPELLPCPLCGSEAIELRQFCRNGFEIRCKSCALKLRQKVLRYTMDWLEQKIVERWNGRANANEIAPSASTNISRDAIATAVKYRDMHSKSYKVYKVIGDYIEWLQQHPC
jgi:hypothetical protein